mgnify:CR=1 FL=1
MACVGCHRRSGMGTAEGPLVVPPLVGSVLFAPVTKGAPQLGPRAPRAPARARPTPTPRCCALRDGVDPSGRPLSPTMPRYAPRRSRRQRARGLPAHARREPAARGERGHRPHRDHRLPRRHRRSARLDAGRPPDVRPRQERRDALRNPASPERRLGHEAAVPGIPGLGPRRVGASRHLEGLAGPARRAVPPAAGLRHRQRHRRRRLVAGRCLLRASTRSRPSLPQTPLPPAAPSGEGFYSLYFSRGVLLEAQAIAHHLGAGAPSREVRQVWRCGSPGQAAAGAVARQIRPAAPPTDCLPSSAPLTAETWRTLVGDARTLVLWLDAGDMPGLEALAASASIEKVTEIYLSSSLLGEDAVRVPEPLRTRAVLAHPFVVPEEFDKHALRSLLWMKSNNVRAGGSARRGERPLCRRARGGRAERPGHARLARVLHRDDRAHDEPVAHPDGVSSVSFDAQRVGLPRRGAYLLKMPASPDESFGKVEEWYVPRS